MSFTTSTYSRMSDGNCVECASHAGRVLVRDSQNRAGACLTFDAASWVGFLHGLRTAAWSARPVGESRA
nr:DUF397 domain-containing protein [Spiractinospora alimapuensis]